MVRARSPRAAASPIGRLAGSLDRSLNGNGSTRLLAAAAALFRRSGYEASTTRELADALGVRSASLYYHIGKKEDLLYSICVESLERITAEVEEGVASEADPVLRLRRLIEIHLNLALADTDKHATMLFELRSLSPRRRASVVALRDKYEALVRKVLTQGQRAGVLRSDVSAKYLTLALLNLLNWTIFWYRPKSGLSPHQISELYFKLFFGGARRQASRA